MQGLKLMGLGLLFVFLTMGCAHQHSPTSSSSSLEPPNVMGGQTKVFQDKLWDDGLAEVSIYDASESRYGVVRDGRAVLIAVKEPFNLEKRVKSDSFVAGKDTAVIKLNLIKDIPTGVYTYRQMASVFFEQSTIKPLKIATSSQEWCGLTSKNIKISGSSANFETFSYFGSEADQKYQLSVDSNTVFEDALPLWIRSLKLNSSREFEFTLVDLQLSSHAQNPAQKQKARIKIDPALRPISVPAGTFQTISVSVETSSKPNAANDVFYLDSKFPHQLIFWERKDGGQYKLKKSVRIPYWKLNEQKHLDYLNQ